MDALPKELFCTIKSFLDDRSRRVIRLASTQWFNIIQYDSFTLYFTTTRQLPQIFQRIQKYKWPISLSFEKSKCKLMTQDYIELAKFSNLDGLQIRNIRTFKTPKEDLWPLTKLTNLQQLDIALPFGNQTNFINRTSLTCAIDESMDVDLTNLTKLNELTIFSSVRADPRPIVAEKNNITQLNIKITSSFNEDIWKRFTNLKELCINTSELDGLDLTILDLPNLEMLQLSVQNIGKISSLPKLTSLVIDQYYECDFKMLSTLTALKQFEIQWLGVDSDVLNMTALTNLEELIIHDVANNEDTLILNQLNLDKLTALVVKIDVRLSDMKLNFERLQKLHLSRNRSLTADILRNFTNLTELHLNTASNLGELFIAIETLTNLKILSIVDEDNLPLNDNVLRIRHLTALERFTFNRYNITHVTIEDIEYLSSLKELQISCQVNDEFFDRITKVTSLETLNLFNATGVSDDMIVRISSLNNLTHLALHKTGAEMTGVTLTCLTSLQRLWLTNQSKLKIYEKLLLDKLPYLYQFNARMLK